jgi:hypothetical protein
MSKLKLGSERPPEEWGPVRQWLEDALYMREKGQPVKTFSLVKDMFRKAKFKTVEPKINPDDVNSRANAIRKQLEMM